MNASTKEYRPTYSFRPLREEDVLDLGEDVMHQFCDEWQGAFEKQPDGTDVLVEFAKSVHELIFALGTFYARPFLVR